MRTPVAVALCALALSTPPTPAQSPMVLRQAPGPRPWPASPIDSARMSVPIYQTHAREGALVAGIPFGLLVGTVVAALCKDTDSNGRGHDCGVQGVVYGVNAAGVAGLVGAMIGSGMRRTPLITDSVTGDHAVVMAAAFAAGGAFFGAANSHADCYHDCLGPTLRGGLINAVIDAAIGYGVGTLFPRFAHR